MITNAPSPLQIDLTDADPTFAVQGRQGYSAKVTIVLRYTGSSTISATDAETGVVLDSQTSTTFGILVYLIENLQKPRYNVISSSVGTFTARVIVEFIRTTAQERTNGI